MLPQQPRAVSVSRAEGVIGLLEENFEASVDRSNRLIDHIMSLTRPQGA